MVFSYVFDDKITELIKINFEVCHDFGIYPCISIPANEITLQESDFFLKVNKFVLMLPS